MSSKREIEIYSAGCTLCEETIEIVSKIACPSCAINVRNMKDPQVVARAKEFDIRTVPAVVIDGRLARCCAGTGLDERTLRTSGLGQPAS